MMEAVVCHGIEDYRLEEVAVPQPGPGEVIIEVEACGICASDVKCFHGAARMWGTDNTSRYIQTPVIPGHEFAGTVVALGEGADGKTGLAIGDRAVSEQIIPCWECRFCRQGQYWMCRRHDIYGFIGGRAEGAWSRYAKFPQGAINYSVPSSMTPQHAALVEPLGCGIHAVERGNIQLGDVVVIAGMGPIGLCILQVARLKGPGLLIALDMRAQRLTLAQEFGADLAINVLEQDAVAKVLSLTEGYGCDVYIEATGAPAAVEQGLKMIRKLGTYVEFSVMAGPSNIDWSVIGDEKELNIHGAHLSPYTYPLAIEYLDKGVVSGDKLITHTLPLSEFRQGIELAHSADQSIKVQLVP